jgi:deoxycytidine triphosphate deaminase
MESPPEVAYGEGKVGNYQGQKGATKAWTDNFFPTISEETKK